MKRKWEPASFPERGAAAPPWDDLARRFALALGSLVRGGASLACAAVACGVSNHIRKELREFLVFDALDKAHNHDTFLLGPLRGREALAAKLCAKFEIKNCKRASLDRVLDDWGRKNPRKLELVQAVLIKKCPKLKDLSPFRRLKNLKEVVVSNCEALVDLSGLPATLRTVTLIDCPRVADVSPLSSAKTVRLDGLPSVTDVSALAGVHTVQLETMPGVRSVAALGRVHRLRIQQCANVSFDKNDEFRCFGLSVQGCSPLEMLPRMNRVHKVEIWNRFARALSLAPLEGVPYVILSYATIESLAPLARCTGVELRSCQLLEPNLSALDSVNDFAVCDCPGAANVFKKGPHKFTYPDLAVMGESCAIM